MNFFIVVLGICYLKSVYATANNCVDLAPELSSIHEIIKADFSGYSHRKSLRELVDQTYSNLIQEASKCSSNIDYTRTIKKYFAVVKDPHIQPVWQYTERYKNIYRISTGEDFDDARFDFSTYSAIGIRLKLFNDRVFINDIDTDLLESSKLVKGDELLSCNHKSPMDIMDQDILPYESVTALNAARYRHISKIFFRWDRKPHQKIKCVFKRMFEIITVELEWKSVSENYLSDLNSEINSEKKIYKLIKKDYGSLVKLTTMLGDNPVSTVQLQQFVKDAYTLRDDKNLILDLRGNSGGSSRWGKNWIIQLFGFFRAGPSKAPDIIMASESNYNHFVRFFDYFEESGSFQNSSDRMKMQSFLDCIKSNLGKLTSCEKSNAVITVSGYKDDAALFKGRLYVLIDWG
ncbi:MAG: hypothetical protein HON90_05150, partial [Halobacteriovoraceae bacterium]|nr:hypothetical protein [Halobacteriovoraceae bacterium]